MVDDITPSSPHAAPARSSDIVAPLSSRTLFWRARYLRQSRFLPHVPFLFWLIETSRPGFVVKLGLGDGVSYFAACQALDKLETQADCVAIDTDEGTADAAGREELRQYNEDNYSEFSQILGADLRRAVNRFPDGAIDMLLVDVDIDDAMIDRLTHEWPRKLSERAVVLFHGTNTRYSEGPAAGFLDRIAATYPHVRFEGGDGLMLVLYGTQRQDRLLRLTDLKPGVRGYSEIHHVFRRLGATHEYECQSRSRTGQDDDLRERLEVSDAELSRLKAENAQLNRRVEELTSVAETGKGRPEAEAALDAERDEVRGADAVSGAAQAEIETLKATVGDLRDEVALRSKELARLTDLLEQAEGQRIEETTELAARAKDAEYRANELKAERDALLGSTSWKLTGPLRSIIRTTRRK